MEKKNSTRKEKLMNYSMVAGAVAAAATGANAQIVYTNVNPDAVVTTGNSYNLDMNNDATPEFYIGAAAISGSNSGVSYAGVGIALTTAGSNAVIGSAAASLPLNYAAALAYNTSIDNTGTFMQAAGSSSSAGLVLAASGTIGGVFPFAIGPWLGTTDMYLGIKFMIGANTHYGWARLDVNGTATQFTVKDYAYDGTADQAILAGDNGFSGVSELNLRDQIDMFIANEQLVINVLNSDLKNGKVIVTNISGQQVASYNLNGNTRFDVSNFASGMYVITVQFEQGIATEKLFVR